MANLSSSPADLWNQLNAQRLAAGGGREGRVLAGAPVRLAISGGLVAYGLAKRESVAKWLGLVGLGELAVEWFMARRQDALERAQPAGAIPVAPGVQYIPPAAAAAAADPYTATKDGVIR